MCTRALVCVYVCTRALVCVCARTRFCVCVCVHARASVYVHVCGCTRFVSVSVARRRANYTGAHLWDQL